MRIAVIGAGYVGLVTGTCLAETGNDVAIVDIDEERINALRAGECPIYEPGLDHLISRNLAEGRLHPTTSPASGVEGREVVFITVSTLSASDGGCDTSAIERVAREIGPHLIPEAIVVLKSTAPVGTTRLVGELIASTTDVPFHVAANPEFLKEGTAVDDFLKPDRVIVGAESDHAFSVLSEIYEPFLRTNNPLLCMDVASSELSKYAANAYLAMRISFVNELALLTEKLGADINAVRRGIGTDPRIGEEFLFPGPGYGGSCLPKDVAAIAHMGERAGLTLELAGASRRVNERQKQYVIERVRTALGGRPAGKRVALWGLSFKARTDDCRESPALTVIEALLADGAKIVAYDPEARARNLGDLAASITLVAHPYEAVAGAHALAVLTEWNEFREPDFARLKTLLAEPAIVDARNLYRCRRVEELGFRYFGIGGHR